MKRIKTQIKELERNCPEGQHIENLKVTNDGEKNIVTCNYVDDYEWDIREADWGSELNKRPLVSDDLFLKKDFEPVFFATNMTNDEIRGVYESYYAIGKRYHYDKFK